MTALALARRIEGVIAPAWRTPLAHLAIAAVVILTLFHRDATDMAAIWWSDSNFGHVLFVPPIIGWLVWQRRHALSEMNSSKVGGKRS